MASGSPSNSPPPLSHSTSGLPHFTPPGARSHKPRSNSLNFIQNRPFMDTNRVPVHERPFQRRKKTPTPSELAAMFAAIEVPFPAQPHQMSRPRFPWEPRPEPSREPSRRRHTFFKPPPFAWKDSTHEQVMPHNKKRKLMYPSAEAWEKEMKRRRSNVLFSNASTLIWWLLLAMVLVGAYASWLSYNGAYLAESQHSNDVLRLSEEHKIFREQKQEEPPETTEYDTLDTKEFGEMRNFKRAVSMDELHSMEPNEKLEEDAMSREHSIMMIQEVIKRREEDKDNIEDVD
ncbi:hypothetical protein BZA77DRAFT_295578 [Pyronema omphalodes]|nr:hypothetical protein BZA77DRAFT_295578 [Pyronema omphalodes]